MKRLVTLTDFFWTLTLIGMLIRKTSLVATCALFLGFTLQSLAVEKRNENPKSTIIENLFKILQSDTNALSGNSFKSLQDDYIFRVAVAFRAYKIKCCDWENQIIKSIPKSQTEFSQLYEITKLNPKGNREDLTAFYEGYYREVFELARRHPEVYQLLFAIAAYGQKMYVDEGPWFCEMLFQLYQKNTRQYEDAILKETQFKKVARSCTKDDDRP